MNSRTSIAALGLVALALVGTTLADPVPPWQDPDQGLSIYWTYDFDNGILDPAKGPTVSATGGNWYDGDEGLDNPTWMGFQALSIENGRLGIFQEPWDSVRFRIELDNRYDSDLEKWFFWEFESEDTGYTVVTNVGTNDPRSRATNATDTSHDNIVSGHVVFRPQPANEWIELRIDSTGDPVWIDKLKLGSVCIPEPASLMLLALGGLGVLRRRRVPCA
jgi:hypothetical protein